MLFFWNGMKLKYMTFTVSFAYRLHVIELPGVMNAISLTCSNNRGLSSCSISGILLVFL